MRASRTGTRRRAVRAPLLRAGSATAAIRPAATSSSPGTQHQHEVRPRNRTGNGSDHEVAGSTGRPRRLGVGSARQAGGRTQGHRRNCRTRSGRRAPYPQRRGPEEQGRESQDQYESWHDEAQSADPGAAGAAQPPGAEDGQLGRGRAWQQVGGGDALLELVVVSQPWSSTHRRRSRLMCAGGPPKPMQPMRPHCGSDLQQRDVASASSAGLAGGVRHRDMMPRPYGASQGVRSCCSPRVLLRHAGPSPGTSRPALGPARAGPERITRPCPYARPRPPCSLRPPAS